MMYQNSALLSIGAALLLSLLFIDVGLAFQIVDRRKDASIVMAGEMKGTANLATTQVSNTPNPCTAGGQGRTGAPGKKRCPPESGEQAADGARYTRQVSNTPNPCGGRTGATCRKQSQPGSAEQATAGARYTSATMLR